MGVSPYRNDLIKGAMAANDLIVEDVARLADISTTTVSTIRTGSQNITLSSLISVAKVLNLDMALLFTPKPEEVDSQASQRT